MTFIINDFFHYLNYFFAIDIDHKNNFTVIKTSTLTFNTLGVKSSNIDK